MTREMQFDVRTMRWWVAFEAHDVARVAGVDRGPEFRGSMVNEAMLDLIEKAHGRLRAARQRRLKNMNRRWRHGQPKRILA